MRRVLQAILRVRAWLLLVLLVAVFGGGESRCMAEQPWPLWQHYATKFLDSSGRIVDRSANDRTTSEGQAYAMFFALVANDQKTFQLLLRWTEDNLAGGDLTARLPAWNWGKTATNEWKPLDTNSAADADLWLAYDCLEAGRLWRDNRLSKLGVVLADRVARSEVATLPALGSVLLPAPNGFKVGDATYLLNLSYLPPHLLARLRQEEPKGPWAGLQHSYPILLSRGSPAGFAVDWISAGSTVAPSPAPHLVEQGKNGEQATGSYDAVRVYLWLGMADHRTSGVREGLRALPAMASYLASHPVPPLVVQSNGAVNDAAGTIGFSAAICPYLIALQKQSEAKAQWDRLAASLDATSGLYGHAGSYYDQNLALFATGWREQRFRFDGDGRLKVRWQ